MKKLFKILLPVLALTLVLALFTACESKKSDDTSSSSGGAAVSNEKAENAVNEAKEAKEEEVVDEIASNTVVMSVEGFGDITLELYPKYAPATVSNFKKLVKEGFYDNTIFHRVMSGFMIQGGGFDISDPDTQKRAPTVKGEFAQNGFTKNTLSHKRGVISLARASDPNSGSSQFFIVHEDSDFLDGAYAAFGEVTDGMDVVDAIASIEVETNPMNPKEQSLPKEYPVVSKAVIKE